MLGLLAYQGHSCQFHSIPTEISWDVLELTCCHPHPPKRKFRAHFQPIPVIPGLILAPIQPNFLISSHVSYFHFIHGENQKIVNCKVQLNLNDIIMRIQYHFSILIFSFLNFQEFFQFFFLILGILLQLQWPFISCVSYYLLPRQKVFQDEVFYTPTAEILTWSTEASWAGSQFYRRSMTRYCTLLGGNLVP